MKAENLMCDKGCGPVVNKVLTYRLPDRCSGSW